MSSAHLTPSCNLFQDFSNLFLVSLAPVSSLLPLVLTWTDHSLVYLIGDRGGGFHINRQHKAHEGGVYDRRVSFLTDIGIIKVSRPVSLVET